MFIAAAQTDSYHFFGYFLPMRWKHRAKKTQLSAPYEHVFARAEKQLHLDVLDMFLSPDSSLLQLRGPCLSQNKPFFNRQGNKSATSPLDDTKSSTLELKKKLKDLLEDLSFSSYFLFIKIGAHLMSVFVLPVVGVVGHGGQKLQEAVEGVAVARWEQVDQKLGDILLLI